MGNASQPAASGKPYQAVGSSLTADDIRAAAAVHHELGPEYSDAVLASFLERVDREVAARVEARLAQGQRADPVRAERKRPAVPRHRWIFGGTAIGLTVGGLPLSLLYWAAVLRSFGLQGRPEPSGPLLVVVALVMAILVSSALSLGLPQLLFRRHHRPFAGQQ
jgi:hypothetical protein